MPPFLFHLLCFSPSSTSNPLFLLSHLIFASQPNHRLPICYEIPLTLTLPPPYSFYRLLCFRFSFPRAPHPPPPLPNLRSATAEKLKHQLQVSSKRRKWRMPKLLLLWQMTVAITVKDLQHRSSEIRFPTRKQCSAGRNATKRKR